MKPFVKWAGGKTQLLDQLKIRIPKVFNEYYEPFVGGGALLFDLKPDKANINDINEQLINVYKQIKRDPDTVINEIQNIESVQCDKEYYLSIRDRYNNKIKENILDAETASLMIWLNKHCFNGLYRVNSKGLFNVPYNNNKKANSISIENLLEVHNYLQDVNITCNDFATICNDVKENDFVYIDSPYIPESITANFTSYTKDGFTMEDHKRLADVYKELSDKGVYVMLSNNDVELVYELYKGFNIETVSAKRMINSKADKRTGQEVIITNY